MNMVVLYRELLNFNSKVLCEFFNYIKYEFKTLRRAQAFLPQTKPLYFKNRMQRLFCG